MGISYNAFKKYFNLANKAGLLIKRGNNFQAVHFVKCLHVLGLNDRLNRHDEIFSLHTYPTVNFTTVYNQVVFATANHNFKKQAYKIAFNKSLFDNRTNKSHCKALKIASKQAAKLCIPTDELLQSIKKKNTNTIVTGKYHLSAIIGCSPSSALNWLRKFHKAGLIKRKVVKEFTAGNSNPEQYAMLIANIKEGKVYPVRGGYLNCKGSQITIMG